MGKIVITENVSLDGVVQDPLRLMIHPVALGAGVGRRSGSERYRVADKRC